MLISARGWLIAATACALLPFALACAIFAAWYRTQAAWLPVAGLLDIGFGLALLPAGLFCVQRYSASVNRDTVPGWFRNAVTAVVMLLGNVPAALGFLVAADQVMSAYRVGIRNDSPMEACELVLRSPLGQYRVGDLAPGASVERTFRFAGEGAVTFTLRLGERRIDGVLDGYVSGNGGSACLTFTPQANSEVSNTACGPRDTVAPPTSPPWRPSCGTTGE